MTRVRMKGTRLIAALMMTAVLALVLAMLVGCASTSSSDGSGEAKRGGDKVLTLCFPSTVTSLDVSSNDATMLKEVAGVLETLVNTDSDFNLLPSLATSWERTGDNTWVFHLREGVKFHDGTDMDAAAVKWCFDRAAANNKSFAKYTSYTSSEVQDDHTLEITTSIPTGELPAALTNVSTSIIAPTSVNAAGEFVQPVGTGYFQYKDFDVSTGEFKCVTFDGYWGGAQDSSIVERDVKCISDSSTRSLAAQNGEVDIATDVPFTDLQTLKDAKNVEVTSYETARTYFYSYNLHKAYLADANVRKALIYALNKEDIVNNALQGVGSVPNGIFMDAVQWNNASVDTYEYNVDLAKQMLDEAGFKDTDGDGYRDWNGESVTIDIVTGSRRPGNALIAQATQGYFDQIGVKAKVNVLDGTAYSQKIDNGDFDMALDSAATGYIPSAAYYLYQNYYSGSSNAQKIGYSNPELDELVAQCRNMEAGEAKNEVSRQAQAIAQNDAAIYTVAHYGAVFVLNPKIEGFSYSAAVHDFIVPYTTDLAD